MYNLYKMYFGLLKYQGRMGSVRDNDGVQCTQWMYKFMTSSSYSSQLSPLQYAPVCFPIVHAVEAVLYKINRGSPKVLLKMIKRGQFVLPGSSSPFSLY